MGFASEAAWTCLACAFDRLGLDEVVAFTAVANVSSEKVMQSIGMLRDHEGDFDHPNLPGHELQRHMLYRITQDQWQHTR